MKTLIAIFSIIVLAACTETQEINQYMLEKDKRKHQDMLEKGARQLEQAELQAKARKEKEEQAARDLKAYHEWYDSLSYEDKMKETRWQLEEQRMKQDREDRIREQDANRQVMLEAARAQERAAAMQALGMINMGRPMLQYTPPPRVFVPNQAPMPAYNPPVPRNPNVNCTSMVNGQQIYTNCQ